MDKQTKEYLSRIGRKGGQKSRRVLTPEQARNMVKAREAKRKAGEDVVNDSINDVDINKDDTNNPKANI